MYIYIYMYVCMYAYTHTHSCITQVDNIDFQSTILSRFDLIFIIRDVRDVERDEVLSAYSTS